jgi:YVTN family beta-propeller protein
MAFRSRYRRAVALALAVPMLGLARTPDGRAITPAGFTIPVENFASAIALSPDGEWLAVLSQDGGAVDVISSRESVMVDRLKAPSATGMTWTSDGLYVSRGYTGTVSRWAVTAGKDGPLFAARPDVQTGPGLVNGVAEDPQTHRLAVARTASHQVMVIDDATAKPLATLTAAGEPFNVGFSGGHLIATLYNTNRVAAWRDGQGPETDVVTGPHPTALTIRGTRAYVANADGHDVVAIDTASLGIVRRYELAAGAQPTGQTPSGMVLSTDGTELFVAESGLNDVAVVDVASGAVRARIPTGWYPMALAYIDRSTVGKKDPRPKPQLWVVSAKGFGEQPDPGGEWNGVYTGIVQHLVVEPNRFGLWTQQVARNNTIVKPPGGLPPIKHIVFIVHENKHFDEVYGDEKGADADPALLLYGSRYTPNAHVLAENYTLFDHFMGDGPASIYGHAWTTQGFVNDYHERNAHSEDRTGEPISERVAWSIWPVAAAGEDSLAPSVMNFDWYKDLAALPQGPRVNVSGVFGPSGELIDALARKGVSFRVYGEQMTMLPDGAIAPGLAAHADRDYPGAHIDFTILDTSRAQLFLDDVHRNGLAQYSYLTLPVDHTAGTTPGVYTPATLVSNNDLALGRIIAGLSRLPEWRNTVVFVTTDDAQGTGDHLDSHRMPALVIGPYVKRGLVDHTPYSIPSILKTVETAFGIAPLSIYDAWAKPMSDAFSRTPDVRAYTERASNVPIEKNPGKASSTSLVLDGPESRDFPREEWLSIKGSGSLGRHEAYLRRFGQSLTARSGDDS